MGEAMRTRRNVIAMAAAAAAGVAATTLGRPLEAAAANGDPITVGATTEATEATFLTGVATAGAVFNVERGPQSGPAISAHAPSGGPAIVTTSEGEDSIGLYAASDVGVGVYSDGGTGNASMGVVAKGATAGVLGLADGIGVYGSGVVGVLGDAGSGGTGVYGFAGDADAPMAPANVGVFATAAGVGTALHVSGKAVFSRSGRISVAKGRTSVGKGVSGVTTSSMVFAVLQQVESGTWVRAAVPTAGKITIYFNRALPSASVVAYFIVN